MNKLAQAMVVRRRRTRILSVDFESLVPHKAVNAKLGNPMELDEEALSLLVDQSD